MRNLPFLWVLLIADGVFGADKVSVSVMNGDSVTLNTGASQNYNKIEWMVEDNQSYHIIAAIENNKTDYDSERRFQDRLKVDHQTGSLTIKNISTEHKGLYKVDIFISNRQTSKEFSVTVRDVVESLSVMEGDSVTLYTGVAKIQRGDVIQWFGDQGDLIADLTY